MEWAETMLQKAPLALRMIKASMNADTDGLAGIQQLLLAMRPYCITQWMKAGKKKAAMRLEKTSAPYFDQFPKFP